MDSDFFLIRKMKRGDEEAMEAFVRKYYPDILRYCCHHVSDREYAMDLTQETFTHFFRALPSYQHMGKALPWLYVTAGNLCRNFYRKSREFATDELMDCDVYSDVQTRILSAADRQKLATSSFETRICEEQSLRQALSLLPSELKEVLILYYFQECRQTEIAQILDISLPLVKYRLRRAKEELKKLLEDSEESKRCSRNVKGRSHKDG